MSTKQQVGVGCLMIVAAVVTAALAVTLGGLSNWGGTTTYMVPLDDAAGISNGARVSVRGVDVGTISKLALEEGRAMVHFSVDDEVLVRETATASVRARSLLGEKYLALDLGEGEPLPEGSELPEAGEQYEVDELFAVLTPVIEAIDPELIRQATETLSKELEEDPELLARILDDAEQTLANTRKASEDLPKLTSDLDATLAQARSSLAVLSARGRELEPILADADTLVERLDAASEPLPATVEEAKLTLEDARALIRNLQAAGEDAEAILARLDGLDRDALHEILREEGIRVRLFGSGKRDK